MGERGLSFREPPPPIRLTAGELYQLQGILRGKLIKTGKKWRKV